MNLFLNKIENLDHRNVYMIKKMIGSLLSEFNQAIEDSNPRQAEQMIDMTNKIYDKIKPKFLWSKRVEKVLTEMAKKLNK